jgi:sulfite oxidase
VWGTEAVSHAEWGGVLLRDVLRQAGITPVARHVAFLGLDEPEKSPDGFGGSIPLEAALNSPVLLADTMNGVPLPPTHGYPLRVIAPGYIGARSVKWLSRIMLQTSPSENYYQQHGYRLFSPSADPETVESDDGIMLGELPVNSVIWQPLEDETLEAGAVTVRGHAYVGGGRTIERVEVSADGGKTWLRATFDAEPQPYVWSLWQMDVNLAAGEHQLVVRAWDSSANSQPESVESVWNFKGYMNNAYHRIQVSAV